MSLYTEFFFNSGSHIVELELLEITHPNFTQAYRIVRNKLTGVTVTLETGASANFVYYPVAITPTGASDDLDQALKIVFGDLGEVLPAELDEIAIADGFLTKPTLTYRTYRSDDLSQPLDGPFTFEIASISFDKQGASFDARAPRLNALSTGELYNLDRFPMLRGFF